MLISQSFLICLFNITLKGKSTLHISQFARRTIAAIYYTAVRLIKNVQENRETEKEISKTLATLIPWIAGLSGPILRSKMIYSMQCTKSCITSCSASIPLFTTGRHLK